MGDEVWREFGAQRANARAAQLAVVMAGSFGMLGPFVLVGGLIGVALFRLLASRPQLDASGHRIRVGRREIDAATIDDATLEVFGLVHSRELRLHFGVRGSTHVVVPLRIDEKEALSEADRDAVIGILELSSITMPPDPFDVTGRFARYNYPTNVTREQAIALVRSPPGPKDPLPIV